MRATIEAYHFFSEAPEIVPKQKKMIWRILQTATG